MKSYIYIAIFCLLNCISAHAQKEAANWYFGDAAGLKFTDGGVVPLENGRLKTIEGSATISDKNGNLLFYTDGSTVYDRTHGVMSNGTNLKGNVSSTQSAIIIPRPANPGRYYIFTVDKPDYFRVTNDPIEGVHYSEVDMSLNNGKGGIIPSVKNVHLITYNRNDALEREYKSSEKISAVISGDCVSYWVVTQFTNKFYAFNVDASGVNTSPVISTLANNFRPVINEQDINVTAAGYLKISPDGKKMAAAYTGTSLGSPKSGTKKTGKVFLYDFDDITGQVSNEELILLNTYPYGVEFSPKSTKLFVTVNSYDSEDRLQSGELFQFDLLSNNIITSQELIHSSNNVAGALQLGIDGKIYRAGYPMGEGAVHHNFLSVINKPEESGRAVNYSHNSVNISPRDVKLGLPPFVQSLFNTNFEYENLCFGDATKFTIKGDSKFDSVIWNFGDGTTSTDISPEHIFRTSGTFTVSLRKIINGIPLDPVCEQLTIVEIPEVREDFILSQCDIGDDNPNDGLSEFNLQLARDYLTNGDNGLQIYFYEDKANARSDVSNEKALNNIYRNKTPEQILFAKVVGFGSECFAISPITLKTTGSNKIYPTTAFGCDTGNNEGFFNFLKIEENIVSELSLGDGIQLTFHLSKKDAEVGINALPDDYTTSAIPVYIRAYKDNTCYGFGSIDLKLNDFPDIINEHVLEKCSEDFPMILGEEINLEDPSKYIFSWSTGEKTPIINILQGGIYSLNLLNEELGCGKTIEYIVEEQSGPIISNIEIINNGNQSDLKVFTEINDENVMYSLDSPNGPFQSSSIFRNVPGGEHIVFAKKNNGCEISEKKVLVFGMPSYFTPNNDGYNDTWKPLNIDQLNLKMVGLHIYDRYGKLLKQLDPYGKGWDGTFNDLEMPSNDYWYSISFEDGNTFQGHFTLLR